MGAIVDGWHRDTRRCWNRIGQYFHRLLCTGFQCAYQVVDFRCQIEIGQVTIHDGDYIFGDIDGVLVIPKEIAKRSCKRGIREGIKRKKDFVKLLKKEYQ